MLTLPVLPRLPQAGDLPRILARPLRLLPCSVHAGFLATALNRIFAPELAAGELNFLQQRCFHLQIQDAGLDYFLTLRDHQLRGACSTQKADLKIAGKLTDLLLLASRQEDSDTLFFRRRLQLSGNTELGLELKNFLDAVDLSGRLGPLEWLLQRLSTSLQRTTNQH